MPPEPIVIVFTLTGDRYAIGAVGDPALVSLTGYKGDFATKKHRRLFAV